MIAIAHRTRIMRRSYSFVGGQVYIETSFGINMLTYISIIRQIEKQHIYDGDGANSYIADLADVL